MSSAKEEIAINKNLQDNDEYIRNLYKDCDDIKIQYFQFGKNYNNEAIVVHCDSLVQEEKSNLLHQIIKDMPDFEAALSLSISIDEIKTFFENKGVSSRPVQLLKNYSEVNGKIVNGHMVIFLNKWDLAISIDTSSVEKRSVAEPQNEVVVVGPREGTIENLQKNLGLIRSRLKTPDLKFCFRQTENKSNLKFVYGYLSGAVKPEVLEEFVSRIDRIKDEEILETAYIAELIEESTITPFPQYRFTERPDVAAASLLEGKIIVLVEGTGTIVICPGLFNEFFQSASDYYQRSSFSSIIRLVRYIGFFLSIALPSIYIALTTFHSELIPTVLLIALLDTREGIPFPALIEALIMIFFFELLQEAGIRLPKPIGSTVSIVGALIIGEASINAGIASPIMVVIIGLTGIASFSIPYYDFGFAARLLRIPLMILASIMGGFGLLIGALLILLHLSKLTVLKEPYLGSLTLKNGSLLKDGLIRLSYKKLLRHKKL
ncbi:spore germination protein [Fictibacillus nanhaiensis]|uniref:spore germination protein n=1 Tax=Fictibacillus nanhaiensis TaxID=742169 RepID=UPI001C96FE65|nr:spore germination protein [Fictibacillus nanhaiensis]MBY6038028.1 spore germination protein [Fictibacillus nanhaiensis]